MYALLTQWFPDQFSFGSSFFHYFSDYTKNIEEAVLLGLTDLSKSLCTSEIESFDDIYHINVYGRRKGYVVQTDFFKGIKIELRLPLCFLRVEIATLYP